jgi:hypothetical protein
MALQHFSFVQCNAIVNPACGFQDRVHEGASSVPELRVLCLGLLPRNGNTCCFLGPPSALCWLSRLVWLAAYQAQHATRETPSFLIR